MLKIICIFLSFLLPISLGVILFTNMEFFQALNGGMAFGSLCVTVLVFLGIAIFIFKRVSGSYCSTSFKLQAIFICLAMLIVPLRAYAITRETADIKNKVDIELIECKTEEGNITASKLISLKVTNNSNINISKIPAKISFYNGTNRIKTYDITISYISAGESVQFDLNFFDSEVIAIIDSSLNIICEFEKIYLEENFESVFEPIEMRLK